MDPFAGPVNRLWLGRGAAWSYCNHEENPRVQVPGVHGQAIAQSTRTKNAPTKQAFSKQALARQSPQLQHRHHEASESASNTKRPANTKSTRAARPANSTIHTTLEARPRTIRPIHYTSAQIRPHPVAKLQPTQAGNYIR